MSEMLCRNGLHKMSERNVRWVKHPNHGWSRQCLACLKANWARAHRKYDGEKRLWAAQKRTHCGKGHPMTPENTYIRPNGKHKECMACKRDYQRIYRQSGPELVVERPEQSVLYRTELEAYKQRQAAKLEAGREQLDRAKQGTWKWWELVGYIAPKDENWAA